MGILDGIFKGGIAGIGDAVKNVVESFKLDPAVGAQLNEKLQETVMSHQEEMQKLCEAQYEAALKDVQDARNTEIKLNEATSASWLSKNMVAILAFFVSAVWGSLTVYLLLNMLNLIAINPNVNMTAVLGVYSALSGSEGIILNFFFGSSSSSQKKDDTIATIAKQP